MKVFTEEQYTIIKQYYDLLTTVDEAFQYIIESFQNFKRTEANCLLFDIFLAFDQITQTHELLNDLLPIEIYAFEEVAKNTELLQVSLNKINIRNQIILELLYPSYSDWNAKIQEKLKPLFTV